MASSISSMPMPFLRAGAGSRPRASMAEHVLDLLHARAPGRRVGRSILLMTGMISRLCSSAR